MTRRDPRRAAPRPGLGPDRARRPGGARPRPDHHRGAAGARCPRPARRRPGPRPAGGGACLRRGHTAAVVLLPLRGVLARVGRAALGHRARGRRGLCRPACDHTRWPLPPGAGSGSSRSGRRGWTRSPCCPGPPATTIPSGGGRTSSSTGGHQVSSSSGSWRPRWRRSGQPTDASDDRRERAARGRPCARSSARHSGTAPSASPSSAAPITRPRSTRRHSPPSAATTRCSPSCPRSRSPQPGCPGRRPSSPTPRATGPACARRAGTGTCSSRRRRPSCRRGSSGWPAPYATSASTPRPRRWSRPPGSRRPWPRSGAGPRSG